MESLALLAAVIVAPAMFGGPIALTLTLFAKQSISGIRKFFIYALSSTSMIVGLYLMVSTISRGATIIGILGFSSGLLAILRLQRLSKAFKV